MKRVGTAIGVVLIVIGAFLLLQSLHVLPGHPMVPGRWGSWGWGAWALAFGVGFLVWANGARAKP